MANNTPSSSSPNQLPTRAPEQFEQPPTQFGDEGVIPESQSDHSSSSGGNREIATGTSFENLFSMNLEQIQSPEGSYVPTNAFAAAIAHFAEFAKEQHRLIQRVCKAIGKSTKEINETRSVLVNEAAATRNVIYSNSRPAEPSSDADQEFRDSIVESLTFMESMMNKMMTSVTDTLRKQESIIYNQRFIKNDIEELKDDRRVIIESLSDLHAKVDISNHGIFSLNCYGDDGDVSTKGEMSEGQGSGTCKGKGKRVKTTITPSGEVVPFIPYEEGIGKRFRGENLPISTRKWNPKRKADYIADRNQEIDKQRIRDAETEQKRKHRKIEDEEAAKKIQELFSSFRKGTWNDSDEVVTGILYDVIKDSEISLADGMTTTECIRWWRCGVIEGENVVEAFNNYRNFRITFGYKHLVVADNILNSRNQINKILDKAREKAKKQQEEHGVSLHN